MHTTPNRIDTYYSNLSTRFLKMSRYDGEWAKKKLSDEINKTRKLVKLLHVTSADTRVKAAKDLGGTQRVFNGNFNELPYKLAVDALVEKVTDSDASVRVAAIKSLGQLGGEKATKSIVQGLNDMEISVQVVALMSLKPGMLWKRSIYFPKDY